MYMYIYTGHRLTTKKKNLKKENVMCMCMGDCYKKDEENCGKYDGVN